MLILFDPIIRLLLEKKTKYKESFKEKKLFMCHLYYEKLETIHVSNNKE